MSYYLYWAEQVFSFHPSGNGWIGPPGVNSKWRLVLFYRKLNTMKNLKKTSLLLIPEDTSSPLWFRFHSLLWLGKIKVFLLYSVVEVTLTFFSGYYILGYSNLTNTTPFRFILLFFFCILKVISLVCSCGSLRLLCRLIGQDSDFRRNFHFRFLLLLLSSNYTQPITQYQ